ncbi:MAG: FecR domain-containing protein [Pseudomonadota bacterium]
MNLQTDYKHLDYPKDIEQEAIEWHLRLNDKNVSAEQEQAFEIWLKADIRHADAYEQAVTMWGALGTLNKNALHRAFFEELKQNEVPVQKGTLSCILTWLLGDNRKWVFGASVTAAVLLSIIMVSSQWLGPSDATKPPQTTTFATDIGQVKEFVLADNSIVTLGASSRIDVVMSRDERLVSLISGAAVFDVFSNPDRPFVVKAEKFSATVRGTVFDVRNSAGVVRLSVAEGAVEVSHPVVVNKTSVGVMAVRNIYPGQQILATQLTGLSDTISLNPENFATWRNAKLQYKNATLYEVISDANRYTTKNIRISNELKSYTESKATLIFNGNDVERLLESLPVLFPVNIERLPSGDILVKAQKP